MMISIIYKIIMVESTNFKAKADACVA
jgi:hypothetical protein